MRSPSYNLLLADRKSSERVGGRVQKEEHEIRSSFLDWEYIRLTGKTSGRRTQGSQQTTQPYQTYTGPHSLQGQKERRSRETRLGLLYYLLQWIFAQTILSMSIISQQKMSVDKVYNSSNRLPRGNYPSETRWSTHGDRDMNEHQPRLSILVTPPL